MLLYVTYNISDSLYKYVVFFYTIRKCFYTFVIVFFYTTKKNLNYERKKDFKKVVHEKVEIVTDVHTGK